MPTSSPIISQIVSRFPGVGIGVRKDPRTRARIQVGLGNLDGFLGGGLPCGGITEIFGGISSGRTTLAHVLISAAIHAGELAAWIDVPNSFDPSCACAAGIDLDRMLWVSPRNRIIAMRAVEQVLDTGGFRVVVLDLDHASGNRMMLPASMWLRIGRVAARRAAAIVVIDAVHNAGAFASLSLEIRSLRRVFAGTNGACPLFEETTSSLCIRRSRFGHSKELPLELVASARA